MSDQGKREALRDMMRAELERSILCKEFDGFTCGCGAVHCDPGAAVAFKYEGDMSTPIRWYLWSVNMREADSQRDYDYSVGIDQFLTREQYGAYSEMEDAG